MKKAAGPVLGLGPLHKGMKPLRIEAISIGDRVDSWLVEVPIEKAKAIVHMGSLTVRELPGLLY